MHRVARYDTKRLKVLLETNPDDIHALNSQGYTPVYFAIEAGNAENLRLFIEAGVEVDMELLKDITLRYNSLQCFKVLLDMKIVIPNEIISRIMLFELGEHICELYRYGVYNLHSIYIGSPLPDKINKLVDSLQNRRLILFLMRKIKKLPNELFRELSYFF